MIHRVMIAAALLAIHASAARAEFAPPANVIAAAKAANCKLNDSLYDHALEPLHGDKASQFRVLATLFGENGTSLGKLCVAVLREGPAGRYIAVSGGTLTTEPAGFSPLSNAYAMVDPTPFHFKPDEIAIAVDTTAELNTTSVNLGLETLYLFRQQGSQLTPIFSAEIEEGEIDKDSGANKSKRWVVRFDTKMTAGAYDLILARKGYKTGKRFVWNGNRYVAPH